MESNLLTDSRDTVLITGFGPFGEHKINASWESVKLLPTMGIEEELGINLVIREVPVEYQYVREIIPKYWQMYKPKLTVHVGVSGMTDVVVFEQQASNENYCRLDINDCCPEGEICIPGGKMCIKSGLDMNQVCHEVNNSRCGVISCVSHDCGRYLCEFIYYTSLSVCPERTAFVHVPVLNKPYSAAELAHSLKVAIEAMLRQLDNRTSRS